MMNKDYKYIKKFIKINVSEICRDLKIDKSNLYKGSTKEENYKLVRENIEDKLARLYLKESEDEVNED